MPSRLKRIQKTDLSIDPSSHIDAASTALLVLDLQKIFLGGIGEADSIVKRTSLAIKAAELFKLPVMVSEQIPEKLGGTIETVKSVLPADTHIFPKESFAVTGSEEFMSVLHGMGVEHVLIAGIETAVCVYQTVLALHREGYGVTILSDCVGGRRPADSQTALLFLGGVDGVQVLPSETVFYSMLGTSSHPDFRAFTQLVKTYA